MRLAAALGLFALVAAAGGGAARSAAEIPACRGGDYQLALGQWNVGGNVLAGAGILTKSAPDCTLTTTVRLAVHYRFGNVDPRAVEPVVGNPTRWRVSRVLHPWSQVVHTWTWRNWCRRPRYAYLVLTGTNERNAQRITVPACR